MDLVKISNPNVLAMISPMSSERVNGIARYAREHGWNLMIQDRLGHHPLAWHGDGIIATLRSDPKEWESIETLMRRGIPLVDLTVCRPEVRVPRVTSDHREIGRLAANHFKEREFHQLAWFSTVWGNVHRLRFEGLTEAFPTQPYKWILAEDISIEDQGDWRVFVYWFRKKIAAVEKPVAIVAYDEADAARLLYAACAIGLSVPEELALLSIGNNPLICENQSVPISSIDQNLERGGYEAAKLLDQLMTQGKRRSKPVEIRIPPTGIVTRRSTEVIAVANETVRRALDFIAKNLPRPIGSPQIADAIGLRRADLDRTFRSELARSVGEEIRRQRLARAKLLLETTDLDLQAIATQTGYCGAPHLANVFKKATGTSPAKWRCRKTDFHEWLARS